MEKNGKNMIKDNFEKGKSIEWINNDIKVKYVYRGMQAFNEYEEIKDVKDILYYYYDMFIYTKKYEYKEDELVSKWNLVTSCYTHDFPEIIDFNDLIKYILKLDLNKKKTRKKAQKIIYTDKTKEYSYKMNVENCLFDDYYEITKTQKGKKKNYSLYIGCSISSQGNRRTTGISFKLNEEDLKNLLDCTEIFINYSIVDNNEKTKLYNDLNTSNKKIESDKIFEYKIKDNKILDAIESIYVIGDLVDVKVREGEHIKSYNNVIITGINSPDKIKCLIETGEEEIKEFNITDIIGIYDDPPEEKLKYKIEEIAKDFMQVVIKNNEYMKKDFSVLDEDSLYKKYGDAIINRTWMCRDEHELTYKKTGHPVKDIEPCVREVIQLIKKSY